MTSSCASGGYTPAAGMTGEDSFVYTVSDGTATDTGTVSVTITAAVGGQTAVKRLTPVADTFVRRSAPQSSFGLMKVLRVGTESRTRS